MPILLVTLHQLFCLDSLVCVLACLQHLDVSALVLNHQERLAEAQTELIKMDSYKSPRDKVRLETGDWSLQTAVTMAA